MRLVGRPDALRRAGGGRGYRGYRVGQENTYWRHAWSPYTWTP